MLNRPSVRLHKYLPGCFDTWNRVFHLVLMGNASSIRSSKRQGVHSEHDCTTARTILFAPLNPTQPKATVIPKVPTLPTCSATSDPVI